jgi:hypothetical protein
MHVGTAITMFQIPASDTLCSTSASHPTSSSNLSAAWKPLVVPATVAKTLLGVRTMVFGNSGVVTNRFATSYQV